MNLREEEFEPPREPPRRRSCDALPLSVQRFMTTMTPPCRCPGVHLTCSLVEGKDEEGKERLPPPSGTASQPCLRPQRATPTTSCATTRPATSCPTAHASTRTSVTSGSQTRGARDKWVSDKGRTGKCLEAHPRIRCAKELVEEEEEFEPEQKEEFKMYGKQ